MNRAELAKAAMQGFCANPSMVHHTAASIADLALQQSDALLAALNITPETVVESQQVSVGRISREMMEKIKNA
jgi:hypothetical protein